MTDIILEQLRNLLSDFRFSDVLATYTEKVDRRHSFAIICGDCGRTVSYLDRITGKTVCSVCGGLSWVPAGSVAASRLSKLPWVLESDPR